MSTGGVRLTCRTGREAIRMLLRLALDRQKTAKKGTAIMKVDAAKVQAATEAIYSALNEFTIGCVNPKAKRAIEPEIAILRSMADGPLNGLVDSLADWVDILF